MSRTSIAKRLRDDEIQYLKDIADGRAAQKHTSEIVTTYHLSANGDIGWPAIACLFVSLFFNHEASKLQYNEFESLIYSFMGAVSVFCPVIYGSLLIGDYKKASEIYPDINAVLGTRTEFIPTWSWLFLPIVFCVLGATPFILNLISYLTSGYVLRL